MAGALLIVGGGQIALPIIWALAAVVAAQIEQVPNRMSTPFCSAT